MTDMTDKTERGTPMDMDTCGACGLPIHPSDVKRYCGWYTTHQYSRCIDLLKHQAADLREQLAGERRRVVEECAMVCENLPMRDDDVAYACAAAIRALAEPQQAALPPGYTEVSDCIKEFEKDPVRAEALQRARARLQQAMQQNAEGRNCDSHLPEKGAPDSAVVPRDSAALTWLAEASGKWWQTKGYEACMTGQLKNVVYAELTAASGKEPK